MTRLRIVLAVIAAAIVVLGIAMGCMRQEPDADGGPVVDMDLMAFLSEARALHHQANLKEELGDLPGAAAAMSRLVQARRPRDAARVPEVQEVLADAHARLGELELRQGATGRAADAIRAGLAYAPEPTYFRGHLLEVEGLVEEARGAELADAGKADDARLARERAIGLLEEVVKIQEQVIQRSLAGRDASAPEAGR